MLILFNGKVGLKQYRILIFLVNGELYLYRPYVGYWKLQGEFLWLT